ncbi:MAG TPA: efflux RND transporter periplasmic adaptor subunit [Terriglobales bacterium]|nr:efflux RND transporter periplasmic adaptor subunit [Terriglobales bacterium]
MNIRQFRTALLIAVVSLGFAGCSQKGNQAAAAGTGAPAARVKIVKAAPQPVGQYTEYLATLKSRNSSILRPEVEGQITEIMVQSGDRVQRGTPLLRIDPRKQQATVNSQEATRRSRIANLEWARTELERRKKLADAGVISRQDLEQAQTQYDAAKADVDALEASVREQRVQLHYFTVNAPAAGVIGDIPVRVGDRVTSTTILTTLDKGGELEAYVSIPAEKAGSVKLGTPVQIVNDAGDVIATTKVSFISPRVDPDTQLLLVKTDVPNSNGQFRNDQVVHVRVVYSQQQQILVPVTAVVRLSGQPFIYVAENNGGQLVAKQRAVQLGEVHGNDYVVLNGVKPGDQMIVTGTQVLADGAPVAPAS